jgi:hypothetical protein
MKKTASIMKIKGWVKSIWNLTLVVLMNCKLK